MQTDFCAVRRQGGEVLETLSDQKAAARVVVGIFPEMATSPFEHVVALALNSRHHLLAAWLVSRGTTTAGVVVPADVFRPAILIAASSVIVAHNHPSGDPEPSTDDLRLTRQLVQAGQFLAMPLLDHIIVTSDPARMTSLRAAGALQ